MANLKISLTDDIKNGLGDSLSNAQLYTTALETLENTYGHWQIVSRAYIQSIIDFPRVNHNDFKTLLKFSQSLSGSVASLNEGGYGHELMSSGILQLIVTKLPAELQSKWGRKIAKSHPMCLSLQDFADWNNNYAKGEMMANHYAVKTYPPASAANTGTKQGRQQAKANGQNNAMSGTSNGQTCEEHMKKSLTYLLCKNDHCLSDCEEFKSKSVEVRATMIKDWGSCLICLSKDYIKRDCLSKKKCGVNECVQTHHALLHGAPGLFQPKAEGSSEEKKNFTLHSSGVESSTSFLRTVPVTIHSKGKITEMVAFLDDGSQATVITERLSKKPGLTRPAVPLPVPTFHVVKTKSNKVSFDI